MSDDPELLLSPLAEATRARLRARLDEICPWCAATARQLMDGAEFAAADRDGRVQVFGGASSFIIPGPTAAEPWMTAVEEWPLAIEHDRACECRPEQVKQLREAASDD